MASNPEAEIAFAHHLLEGIGVVGGSMPEDACREAQRLMLSHVNEPVSLATCIQMVYEMQDWARRTRGDKPVLGEDGYTTVAEDNTLRIAHLALMYLTSTDHVFPQFREFCIRVNHEVGFPEYAGEIKNYMEPSTIQRAHLILLQFATKMRNAKRVTWSTVTSRGGDQPDIDLVEIPSE